MTTLETRQNEFVDNMAQFELWNDKFDYLIELSEELPNMPEHMKTGSNRILNCISKTFFCVMMSGTVLKVYGWSNASVMSGILEAVRTIFDGLTPAEITGKDIYFHTQSNLLNNLTPQRQGALLQIIGRIQTVAANEL